MITCDYIGGLGNQLFMIFNCISYSLLNNEEYIFKYKKNCGNRNVYWDTLLKNIKNKTTNNILNYTNFNEKGFEYNELPKNMKNICFIGYYQSYKYFEEKFEEIVNIIKLREIQEDIKKEYKLDYNGTSIHYRSGDYKKFKEHYVLKVDYYIKSINYILNKEKIEKIYIFSEKESLNEIIVIKKELEKKYNDIIFEMINNNMPDWKQLIIMSLIKNNIIANSTFSYWGAILNKNEKKIVTYPKKWFGEKNKNFITRDLCPKEWIFIE